MTQVRAVILDIDGTLIYSNDEHTQAFLLAAEELGFPCPDFAEVRRMIGMGGDKLIPAAFGFEAESPKGKALDERKGEIFRARFAPHLQPTPGARALVERLRREGIKLVVATSANEEDLEILLKQAGVADLLEDRTSSDDVEESKPEPDLVLAALRLAGVSAKEALMLGDTPYDVEAATRAGVGIVAVKTGGWAEPDLAGAIEVYDTPEAILGDYSASPFA